MLWCVDGVGFRAVGSCRQSGKMAICGCCVSRAHARFTNTDSCVRRSRTGNIPHRSVETDASEESSSVRESAFFAQAGTTSSGGKLTRTVLMQRSSFPASASLVRR